MKLDYGMQKYARRDGKDQGEYLSSPFSRCMERTSYVFPLPDGVFLPCDHGLDL